MVYREEVEKIAPSDKHSAIEKGRLRNRVWKTKKSITAPPGGDRTTFSRDMFQAGIIDGPFRPVVCRNLWSCQFSYRGAKSPEIKVYDRLAVRGKWIALRIYRAGAWHQ